MRQRKERKAKTDLTWWKGKDMRWWKWQTRCSDKPGDSCGGIIVYRSVVQVLTVWFCCLGNARQLMLGRERCTWGEVMKLCGFSKCKYCVYLQMMSNASVRRQRKIRLLCMHTSKPMDQSCTSLRSFKVTSHQSNWQFHTYLHIEELVNGAFHEWRRTIKLPSIHCMTTSDHSLNNIYYVLVLFILRLSTTLFTSSFLSLPLMD